jgi:hypothetical protein
LSDLQKNSANPHASASGKKGLSRLSVDAVHTFEQVVEERFREWATDLISHERWTRYHENLKPLKDPGRRRDESLHMVRVFAGDYADLLGRAVLGHAKELVMLLRSARILVNEVEWQDVHDASFRFVERFTRGAYEEPWNGFFIVSREIDLGAEGPDLVAGFNRHTLEKFQRPIPLTEMFRIAEEMTSPERVKQEFSREIDSKRWKDDAANRAENEFRLVMVAASGDQTISVECADSSSATTSGRTVIPQVPAPGSRSWQEIEISFLSDERVEICDGPRRETRNYSELGFEDRRSEKPNRAWVALRELAQGAGTIPTAKIQGKQLAQLQKRIEEIRERLRNHFQIATDPIPFSGTAYQISFKLSRRLSYDT